MVFDDVVQGQQGIFLAHFQKYSYISLVDSLNDRNCFELEVSNLEIRSFHYLPLICLHNFHFIIRILGLPLSPFPSGDSVIATSGGTFGILGFAQTSAAQQSKWKQIKKYMSLVTLQKFRGKCVRPFLSI